MKRVLTIGILILLLTSGALAATPSNDQEQTMGLGPDFEALPTFITSDSLLLKSDQRIFTYTGNVVVKHGDMTLTSDTLEGTYDDQNHLRQLIANSNVVITKGPDIRATSQYALYDKATETVTLTKNPALEQKGSTLEADKVLVFLKENRSTAEGSVRVKLLNVDDQAKTPNK